MAWVLTVTGDIVLPAFPRLESDHAIAAAPPRRRRLARARLLVFAIAVLLGACGLALLDGVRYPMLGWLRGEPFFDGMPASYYAEVCLHERPDLADKVADYVEPISGVVAAWCRARSQRDVRCFHAMTTAPEAVPVMRVLARHPDWRARYTALRCLGRQGGAPYPALDVAREALIYENRQCREAAAQALARIDPSARR